MKRTLQAVVVLAICGAGLGGLALAWPGGSGLARGLMRAGVFWLVWLVVLALYVLAMELRGGGR